MELLKALTERRNIFCGSLETLPVVLRDSEHMDLVPLPPRDVSAFCQILDEEAGF